MIGMPYTFPSPVECPLSGCNYIVHNTGALGTHLSRKHGITDKEFRQYIVSEVKRRVLNNEEPLKLTIDEFREMYNHHLEEVQRERRHIEEIQEDVQRQRERARELMGQESSDGGEAQTIAPSAKVLAVVDSMNYDEHLKDEIEEGEAVVMRRRMPISVRPVTLTLSPYVWIYYDWVRNQGYKKSLSEFINEVIQLFFRERGIGVGIVVLDNE